MTEKKYRVHDWVKFDYSEIGKYIGEDYTDKPLRNDEIVDLLNSQRQWLKEKSEIINNLKRENEQLKQDNNALIHLLENQSIIIQELHSKLLEYQVKEPIILTKEDVELMDKAISYYTHGRYGE